jgi:hypothetical protein
VNYLNFVAAKSQLDNADGFAPVFMPDYLFPFQSALVEWACKMGRDALFEDCGLGKTIQECVFAENVVRKTNGNVLIAGPLAVSRQIVREAEKFGIEAKFSRGEKVYRGITVTNYENLHKFDANDFVGFVGDESSILKSFDGQRRAMITQFCRKLRYRLLSTATPSPNDYIELGTTSEALGYLGYMDMLNRFFKNDLNNSASGRMRGEVIKWRLKGHAETPFWRWVCSWARALRKPSDLGFDDTGFVLPPLTENEHIVDVNKLAEGMLFSLPAIGLKEQREERRRSLEVRCQKAASLVINTGKPAVTWCDLNDEGDMLATLIPDAIQVSGSDSDEEKEEKLVAFSDGKIRVLVTKQKIAGWGMNWQHCSHMTDFPSHSFEGYYQKVRRFWRFGQKNPVTVDLITTDGQREVLKNQKRKADQADRMFEQLVAEMNTAMSIDRLTKFNTKQETPSWLSSIK